MQGKLLRRYTLSRAKIDGSSVFEELPAPQENQRWRMGNSAYLSTEEIDVLDMMGCREPHQRQGARVEKLTEEESQGKRSRTKFGQENQECT